MDETQKPLPGVENLISFCSGTLLAEPDSEKALQNALVQVMGQFQVHRIYLFENIEYNDRIFMRPYLEICADAVFQNADSPYLQEMPYDDRFSRWKKQFVKKEPVYGVAEEFPEKEQEIFFSQNIVSILVFPVFCGKDWFGFLRLDDVKNKRNWNRQEKWLLQTLAEMVSAYLYRQKTRKELAHAQREAESANIAKNRFLANISHEIRTPLNAIIGMTGLLMEKEHDIFAKDCLNTIHLSSQMLNSLINDILDFSKIEAGKLELECFHFNLQAALSGVEEIILPKARDKNLDLDLCVADDLPEVLFGDPGRLCQVLINLLSNAVKFTETGKIMVRVSRKAENDEHIKLTFRVSDTGIGIPGHMMDCLFRPFSQVDTSVTRKHGGTGLGLVISRELVRMMGGIISVESEEGRGTTFRFTADFEKVQEEKISTIPTEIKYYPNDMPGRKKNRILLVEDNPANQVITQSILTRSGFLCDIAGNGKEAVEILKTMPYDMVLMDIQMPVMDGVEATRIIRDPENRMKNPEIPIIAVTAHALKGDRENYIAAGMNDYIAKPIDPARLIQVVEKNLVKMKKNQHTQKDGETRMEQEDMPEQNHLTEQNRQARKMTDKSVFDKNELFMRVGSDAEIFHEVVNIFMKSIPAEIQGLKNALGKENQREIISQAHKIKGMFANLSAHRLAKISQKIETLGKDNHMNGIIDLLKEMDMEFDNLVLAISELETPH